MPCNVIPDEILTDHPDRFRAMIVESANPAHSLADSQRMREAFEALDLRRRDRRGDDRDGAAGRLRAARREPVREARGDVLQPRVPAQHLPPAPPAAGAAARDAAGARDLGAPGARAGRRRRGGSSSRCARPRARAARPTRRRSMEATHERSRRWRACCPTCSTRRSARRCPRACRARPRCGASRSAAR